MYRYTHMYRYICMMMSIFVYEHLVIVNGREQLSTGTIKRYCPIRVVSNCVYCCNPSAMVISNHRLPVIVDSFDSPLP